MTLRRNKLGTALACITGAGAFNTVTIPAHAADVMVEVTGSHIKRAVEEGALPLQTITREEIAKSGAQTAFDILERVSAMMGYGSFPEPFSLRNFMSQGSAAVSMRGLGIDKTLVLLNGRRIANYALSRGFPGVDLNSIPTSVIDRVEILKDGASAIYGTDAIAGVINFITRKDFSGVDIVGYYSSPQDRGGEETRATLTVGWGDLATDKFNAWFAYDYLDRQALAANERAFSRNVYRPDIGLDRTGNATFPANVFIPGVGTRSPTDPTPNAPGVNSAVCNPPFSFPSARFPHECRSSDANDSDLTTMVDPSIRQSVFGHMTWQMMPELQLFGEAAYSRNHFTKWLTGQSVNAGTAVPGGMGVKLPPTSPYYPTAWLEANYPSLVGQPLTLLWNIVDNGRRDSHVLSEQTRIVAGLKGTIKSWDYEAALNYNRSNVENSVTRGTMDRRIFLPLMDSGVINPFGPNTPEVIAQIQSAWIDQVWQSAHGTVKSIDFKTSGHAAELPAGPLALALGGEYRKEDLTQWHAPVLESGDVLAGSTVYTTGAPADRNVGSLFAEAYIPIVKSLEAQVAVRYDHYSDFGSTTNPKVALRWQPARQILFRGSWSEGFHAPSLVELYQPLFLTSALGNTRDDPLRCPVTKPSPTDCAVTFKVERGGNPDLRPETSDQWSLGFVLDPLDGVSMSLDWFHIDVHDVIASRTDDLLAKEMGNPDSPFIVRGPVDDPMLPGPIIYWRGGAAQNLGRKRVEGIDIDLRARSPSLSFGRLSASFNGTYLTTYNESRDDGSFPNIVGTRGAFGAIPRWKHVLTFDWTQGPWNASVIEYYTHSYSEPCIRPADPSGCTWRTVGAYETWDLSGAYTGFQNTTLRLGIKNVLNRDPPISNQALSLGSWTGFDPSMVDPRGRTFWASIRYAFK